MKYGLTLRRGLIVFAVVTLAAWAYLIFAPLGLLWLYRTGGWDSWSKVLDGQVTDQGAAVFPVHLKWDSVYLTVIETPSAGLPPTDEVTVQVVADSGQSIVVDCAGRQNKQETDIDPGTSLYEHTTGGSVRVYEGSLTELSQRWKPIHVMRGDGGNRIDFQLIVIGKTGPFQKDAIPFTIELQWHSVGF